MFLTKKVEFLKLKLKPNFADHMNTSLKPSSEYLFGENNKIYILRFFQSF